MHKTNREINNVLTAFNDIVDNGISIEYFNAQAEKRATDNTILLVQHALNHYAKLRKEDKNNE